MKIIPLLCMQEGFLLQYTAWRFQLEFCREEKYAPQNRKNLLNSLKDGFQPCIHSGVVL